MGPAGPLRLPASFSSIVLASAIKKIAPHIMIVLGGTPVAGAAGPSLLNQYPFIDYVIQGEGEKPLVGLLDALREPRPVPPIAGLISRSIPLAGERNRSRIEDLDSLPLPNYDEYVALSYRSNILWYIPIEGSRGCWWDRSASTGNPRDRCYFCNYSSTPYRAKSAARLASEMAALTDRYRNLRFGFSDNAMRTTHLQELAEALHATGKEYSFFAAIRANIRHAELAALRKAGLVYCEIGIEGFSAGYLRRLNKGTSVILNLQALKTCHELGLRNNTTLITGFPGSIDAEVTETVQTIERYAVSYSPAAKISPFQLSAGCVVDRFREEFSITRVEKHQFYRVGLPEDVFGVLELNELAWQSEQRQADWTPVGTACSKWEELLQSTAADPRLPYHHPLYYQDGGTFLEILDRRHGYRSITLNEPWRSIYLFSLQIRSRESIERHFAEAGAREIAEALRALLAENLMFEEDDHFLSLAVASTPELAEIRIRAASDSV